MVEVTWTREVVMYLGTTYREYPAEKLQYFL
jgi:hypothetical protein